MKWRVQVLHINANKQFDRKILPEFEGIQINYRLVDIKKDSIKNRHKSLKLL